MENVVGLIKHKNGRTIEIIMQIFKALGYTVGWKVLNAVHYGVPQRRERVVIIGNKMGGGIQFPEPTHCYSPKSMAVKSETLLSDFVEETILLPAITVNDAISDLSPVASGEESDTYISQEPFNDFQKAMRGDLEKVTLHKSTKHSPKMLEIIRYSGANIYALPNGLVSSGFSTSYSRLDAEEPSVTLTVNFVHPASNKCIHPYQDRALTPREGARLQSFPDSFIFKGSRQKIVKQIGNAVPPLLSKAIAESLFEQW